MVHREIAFVEKLQNTLATGVSKGKTVFKVWMEEASNTIQTLARTYGERVVADSCILSLNDPDAQSNRLLLQKLYALNNLVFIQRDLAWYDNFNFIHVVNIHINFNLNSHKIIKNI